jgi:hypothetical protein
MVRPVLKAIMFIKVRPVLMVPLVIKVRSVLKVRPVLKAILFIKVRKVPMAQLANAADVLVQVPLDDYLLQHGFNHHRFGVLAARHIRIDEQEARIKSPSLIREEALHI